MTKTIISYYDIKRKQHLTKEIDEDWHLPIFVRKCAHEGKRIIEIKKVETKVEPDAV